MWKSHPLTRATNCRRVRVPFRLHDHDHGDAALVESAVDVVDVCRQPHGAWILSPMDYVHVRTSTNTREGMDVCFWNRFFAHDSVGLAVFAVCACWVGRLPSLVCLSAVSRLNIDYIDYSYYGGWRRSFR